MGRKTKLTPELQAQFERMMSNLVPIEAACDALGIHHQTFYNWMERGSRARRGLFFEFFEAITQARGLGEVNLLQTVNKSAETDWRAAVWLLTVRRPETYRPPTRLEHSGKDGSALPAPSNDIIPPVINVTIEAAPIDRPARQALRSGGGPN